MVGSTVATLAVWPVDPPQLEHQHLRVGLLRHPRRRRAAKWAAAFVILDLAIGVALVVFAANRL